MLLHSYKIYVIGSYFWQSHQFLLSILKLNNIFVTTEFWQIAMLLKNTSRPVIQGIILTSLLTLSSSCGNSAALESLVSADPELKKSQTEQVSNKTKSKSSQQVNSSPKATSPEAKTTNQSNSDAAATKDSNSIQTSEVSAENKISLLNFPDTFPVYPQAELQKIQSDEANNSGTLIWKTTDNRQAVADYYQAELLTNDWDIIKPFALNPKQKIARAIAVKDNLRVELSLSSLPAAKSSDREKTKLLIVYSSLDQDIPRSSISQGTESSEAEPNSTGAIKPTNEPTKLSDAEASRQKAPENSPQTKANQTVSSSQATKSNIDRSTTSRIGNVNTSSNDFADLDRVPEQLQQSLESVAALGILTPYTGKANVELSKFAPNEVITRGEYARWLIAANNRYYADNPGKKIYVAAQTNESAFNDVKSEHPDYDAIQSLAEAGLIPSRLTDDSTQLSFRPDAPLTREDLITWKVPLDLRQALPQASIEAIEESWGFQDAKNIDSSAIRALYADFQNGDNSNIRRVFGYTTLFQPNKPITRAEAAASLWYFGYQGDGITAKEALKSEDGA